ncbi:DUF5684 domain-containing protein [uncultured Microbacterium sp.]|uniref:DUF5684 domain-containing protein n=1 Tax=uncultured Microbacterium sp. TaxID=191216 RepID=UPI0028DCD5CE|nr:DUF5684 domain-containing protein [uncultured Microbacterium sp.]
MTPSAASDAIATFLVAIGVGLIIAIGLYVWYAIALSRLFPRIGGESWKGWVPVLNEAEILARGGVPAWSVVFYFIPIVQLYGIYLKVRATHRINQQFGRGAGSTVLAILLPPVWATVLAVGAPPYPEGDRLAALQPPGPRRTPQPYASDDAEGSRGLLAPPAPQRLATSHAGASPQGGFIPSAPTAPAASSALPPEWQAFAPAPQPPSPPQAPAAPAAPAPTPVFAETPTTPAPFAETPAPAAPFEGSPFPAPSAAPAPAAPASEAPAVPTASVPAPSPFAPPVASEAPLDTVPAPPPAAPYAQASSPVAPEVPAAGPVASASEPYVLTPQVLAAPGASPLTHPAPPAEPAAPTVPTPIVPAPPTDALDEDVAKTVVVPRRQDDDLEATVIVARKRGVRRSLVLDDGRTFALSGASVVIGRNPVGEPGEQRLAITDATRTLSKTHARLVVTDDEWRLTDLHATNGVVVVAEDGTEVLLDPGESVLGTGRFVLGEVGMHVVAESMS